MPRIAEQHDGTTRPGDKMKRLPRTLLKITGFRSLVFIRSRAESLYLFSALLPSSSCLRIQISPPTNCSSYLTTYFTHFSHPFFSFWKISLVVRAALRMIRIARTVGEIYIYIARNDDACRTKPQNRNRSPVNASTRLLEIPALRSETLLNGPFPR